MAAVRAVEESAIRGELEVGAVAAALEVIRKGRKAFMFGQGAGVRVAGIAGDRVGELVDRVEVFAIGRESEVARSGARRTGDESG